MVGELHPLNKKEALMEDKQDPKVSQEQEQVKSEDRKNPKMGTITKEGLVVGRGDRKQIIPPDEVEKLALLHCTNKEIAEFFGITVKTLEYNFAEKIQKARNVTKQRLRRAQLEVALKGNVPMLIWLGKNILSQSDSPMDGGDLAPLPWTDDAVDKQDDK
jgi:hypothetical protein